jgi:integrase
MALRSRGTASLAHGGRLGLMTVVVDEQVRAVLSVAKESATALSYVKKLRSHLRDKRWPRKPYTGPGWEKRGECPPGKVPGARRLSLSSVNDILSVLSSILESARQDGLIETNAAAAKGTRVKVERRAKLGTWLDYDQVVALLDASQEIDLTSSHYPHLGRRAFNGCLYLGAARVSEACKLERRDVNWERGTIRVRDAKTPAGYRDVPMHRMLFDVMAESWSRRPETRPKALLFANRERDATQQGQCPRTRTAARGQARRRTTRRATPEPDAGTDEQARQDRAERADPLGPPDRHPARLPPGAQPPQGPAHHRGHGRGPRGGAVAPRRLRAV